MGSKINKIGEEKGINNFGSKMIITEYRKYSDIDVYFPEYNWTFKHSAYKEFKKGNIKCPYEARVYSVGYMGEGKYISKINGKLTKCYQTWMNMLGRCYDEKLHKKHHTYINCEVCDEWLCFQNFARWYDNNYYEVKGQIMDLDKDILYKGNKIYSPNTCIFVPHNINLLFIKGDKARENYPIGVCYHKRDKKFQSYCNIYDYEENKTKKKYLGSYDTPEKAFEVYKQYKEKYIKKVADYYKDKIPDELYQGLYNYEVEITD